MVPDPTRTFDDRLVLRTALRERDEEFLRQLFRESRSDLDGVFPDEDQQRQLIDIQYRGQTLTYAREFPDASHSIIELDGRPVGRLMVCRRPAFILFLRNRRRIGFKQGLDAPQ